MKRYLACLVFALLLLVDSTGSMHSADKSTQESFNCDMPSCIADCESDCFTNPTHAIAYAENGTFTQLVTGTNYSPRSGFPTLTITRNIPSPSFEGHGTNIYKRIVIGRISPVHAKLYVLRV